MSSSTVKLFIGMILLTVAATARTGLGQAIDFESPLYVLSDISDPGMVDPSLIGQDGWVIGTGEAANELAVLATADSGLYVGGQAGGHVDTGGNSRAGRLGGTPDLGNRMTADFFANDPDGDGPDSNVRIFPWVDVNNDGVFDSNTSDGERQFGFGLDSNGEFHVRPADSTTDINSTATYAIDTWYRVTAAWTDPVAGNREMTLTVLDLTNNTDLGVVLQTTLSESEFGLAPSTYEGVALRITRGAVDNIGLVPEPSSVMLLGLGGLMLLCRRQR